jgi:hypothetical protein
MTLDISQYSFDKRRPQPCQLVGVIAHEGGHDFTFICLCGQWMRFDETDVTADNQTEAVEENFPIDQNSNQTASILLYQADT